MHKDGQACICVRRTGARGHYCESPWRDQVGAAEFSQKQLEVCGYRKRLPPSATLYRSLVGSPVCAPGGPSCLSQPVGEPGWQCAGLGPGSMRPEV